jgi:hypothetical protein
MKNLQLLPQEASHKNASIHLADENRVPPPSIGTNIKPPAWRWETARLLVQAARDNQRLNVETDSLTNEAVEFINLLDRCRYEIDFYYLERKFPYIYSAWYIYSDVEPFKKWMLEARILANQPPEEIEQKTGLNINTLDIYEKLFFDVRPHLSYKDYIYHYVIGVKSLQAAAESQIGIFWKLIAYHYGAEALEAFAYLAEMPDNIIVTFEKDIKSQLIRKAIIAARNIPVTFNQKAILEILNNWMKQKEQINVINQTNTNLEIDISKLMESIGETIAIPGTISPTDEQIERLLDYKTIVSLEHDKTDNRENRTVADKGAQ